MMEVHVNGVSVGKVEVRSTTMQDYSFSAPTLVSGAKVDVIYSNDTAPGGGIDRNLFLSSLRDDTTTFLPTAANSSFDRGPGGQATDGIDVIAGTPNLYWNGALRLTWPAAAATDAMALARRSQASRLLQQATFGPTPGEIERVAAIGHAAWLNEQIALPFSASYVPYVQSMFDRGTAYQPYGASYTTIWPAEAFWKNAATAPDQLRQKVGYALQQIFVVSLADGGQWSHARPFAHYLDTLNKNALGNFRTLMEDVALSPTMGLYLTHMRNQKEDPATNRLPDENFARELMQLFTIGLTELNIDGTPKLDAQGSSIETYTNQDVMALAKVFTGWSWGFDDAQLTDTNFLTGVPKYNTTGNARIDLRPMKNYTKYYSTSEKVLFAGKPHAVTIPAGTSAQGSLKMALDALFQHPNVGPFIGRQLIQRLVTSNPSPGYVARVALVFNNNGSGVRGDMSAVVKTILLDPEARAAPSASFGKLREPVLRVTHWMRAFGATSVSGRYMLGNELVKVSQRALHSPTVFNFYRPGYVPPNTPLASSALVAPEFQIANESTVAAWVNQAEAMITDGIGWSGSAKDVTATMAALIPLAAQGPEPLTDQLNVLLFGGQMSESLRLSILEAVTGVNNSLTTRDRDRARVATFIAMSSPEYMIQR